MEPELRNDQAPLSGPDLKDDAKYALQPVRDDALIVSAFADWKPWPLIKKFWRLYLTGMAVSSAGIYLGYTLTLPGSIVANQGFVNQFATVTGADGRREINAQYIGVWGAINLGSQVVTQIISPITANYFGVRFNTFTLLIALAIVLEIVVADDQHVFPLA